MKPKVAKGLLTLARRSRKKKKGKSPRSQFYSKLMGGLAGNRGESISNHFVKQDGTAFAKAWWRLSYDLMMQATPDDQKEKMEEVLQRVSGQVNEIGNAR